jgi:hypothetical protein
MVVMLCRVSKYRSIYEFGVTVEIVRARNKMVFQSFIVDFALSSPYGPRTKGMWQSRNNLPAN